MKHEKLGFAQTTTRMPQSLAQLPAIPIRYGVRTYVRTSFESSAIGHNTILYATTYVAVVEEFESRAIRNNTILYDTTYVAVESPSI
jgi:hypothetical protein